jgi:hypothetical protein
MRELAPLILLLCVGLVACEEEFKPETVVEGLRVLGLRATPAELAPGQSASLSALVVDPSRPGRGNTLLWLGCEPDPLNLGRSLCSDTRALEDPGRFLPSQPGDGSPPELPEGVSVIGFNDTASYPVRADLFRELAPEDPRRRTGTIGQVLLLAIAAEVNPLAPREELEALFERVRNREIPSLLTLFRLRVSEDTQVNANPVLERLVAGGEPLSTGATLRLHGREPTPLDVAVPDSALETYTQRLADGQQEQRTEQFIAAWYATAGRFDPERVVLRSGTPQVWLPPDGRPTNAMPPDRRGRLWVVVRDTRGGTNWLESPFYICDESLPAPRVTAVETEPGGLLVLRGESLSSVLDVVVGGQALTRAAYSASRGTYEGLLPVLPPGEYAVQVRGRHCRDEVLAERYSVR